MINIKLCCFLLCCFLLACADRNSPLGTAQQFASPTGEPNQVKSEQKQNASPAKGRIDACALITNQEVQAVQGDRVEETKSSARVASDFIMSQCFYRAATFENSVSLEVTQSDPAKPAKYGPRDRWKELFHRKDRKAEDQKESGKPLSVPGIGEEAFWVGDRVVGALYVLKKDAYLRISVGGPQEYSVKVNRSKALAEKALKRL